MPPPATRRGCPDASPTANFQSNWRASSAGISRNNAAGARFTRARNPYPFSPPVDSGPASCAWESRYTDRGAPLWEALAHLTFAAIDGQEHMKAALLPDRGVVNVAGDDARPFLNGLFTTDVGQVTADDACFAALLTPQGKIIVDVIVAEAPAQDGGGFFLDTPKALAKASVDRLNFYKLRSKVMVEDLSEVLGVMA